MKIRVKFDNNCSEDSQLLHEYKKVVDTSSIVSIVDKKGIITYANSEFCRISGYTKSELIGKPHNIVRHPNMPSSAFKDLWSTIKAKKVWKGIVENLKKDGGSYFVKATIVPILDKNGEIIEYIGLREDITDLIEKEREIERLNSKNLKNIAEKAFSIKTSKILESIPVPLVLLDKNNNILQHNSSFYNLFDIDSSDHFLTSLAKSEANIEDVFTINKDEDDFLDWKDEAVACERDIEIKFKDQYESSGKKFSLRLKEDEKSNYIAAFV